MRILCVIPMLMLIACTSASTWQKAPTPKLCQQLAKEEPHVLWGMSGEYHAIVEELDRRGEDCDAYIRQEMRRTEINNTTNVRVNNN
jgi:hypothetical protein